jgi:hypothetical protein
VAQCLNVISSVVFLKKIGSGMHSDSKISRRERGVSYIDANKKRVLERFLLRKNFQNGVPAQFQHKNIPGYESSIF